MELTPEEEDLLARVVAGELEREHPSVRRRTSASDPFLQALEELERMKAALDGVRLSAERELALARASVTAEDRRMTRAAIEPWLARGRRRPWLAAAALFAAAACVLLLGLQRGWWSSAPPLDDGPLGYDVRASPQGPDPSLASYSLALTLAPLQRVIFVLYDERGTEILRSPDLETSTWHLAPEQIELLPASLTWTYEVRDPSGNSRFGGPFRAWRSP